MHFARDLKEDMVPDSRELTALGQRPRPANNEQFYKAARNSITGEVGKGF